MVLRSFAQSGRDVGARSGRPVAPLTCLLLAAVGALPAAAGAAFHLQKVTEVMLASGTGDRGVQFVELFDDGGPFETFPVLQGPYKLVVYDAAGSELGEHVLSAPGMNDARAAGRRYLVSTAAADAAFGVSRDEVLDVELPQTAGQACFTAGSSDTAYSCLTWGRLARAVPTSASGTGSANGRAPPPGESAQRQPDDTVETAPPTPKAPPPTPPFAGVSVVGRTARVDRRGRAPVRLRCPAETVGACEGRLRLSVARQAGSAQGKATFTIRPGRTRTVRVRLARGTLRRLARERRLRARLTISARDSAGQRKATRERITLLAARR